MSSDLSFREASHHWLEIWVKGILVAFGGGVVSLLFGDYWEKFGLRQKIIWLFVGLITSALVCYVFGRHHCKKQKEVDERQGLKRMKT